MSGAFNNLNQLMIHFGVDDARYLGLAITDQLDIAGMVWIRRSKLTATSITLNIGLRSVQLNYPFTTSDIIRALEPISRP